VHQQNFILGRSLMLAGKHDDGDSPIATDS
jgi:hypothetical protein